LVHKYPNEYIKSKKYELIKGEYVTKYSFFKSNHISKLLWGRCLVFEGIEQSGWYPRKNDLIIVTESHLSRKNIRQLNIIANLLGRELFVNFSWGPKGIGSTIISIIIEVFTEELIKKIFKRLFEEKKCFTIKYIDIKLVKNKQYLEIIDNNDDIYEFVINCPIIELENKVLCTMDSLNVPYSSEELNKYKNTYDRYGNRIDYNIEGKRIKIDV